jgi:hypothetical protein
MTPGEVGRMLERLQLLVDTTARLERLLEELVLAITQAADQREGSVLTYPDRWRDAS